ncbi:MAG: hypothetical protein M1834_003914 [Cirrosporium novae-zelandiae]|nr:MAG: hypothetical protein M1834_003914 [Cirrosporium novae-zelandiae]
MSYNMHRPRTARSDTSSSSTHRSHNSYQSQSTVPTVASSGSSRKEYPSTEAPLHRHEHVYEEDYEEDYEQDNEYEEELDNPRVSTDTYTSTVPSNDDLPEEPQYEVWEPRYDVYESEAVPSTPHEFAQLFPSTRRLLIHHDDSTIDGNMNLRIDTEGKRKQVVTLFHLRMHDLRKREFSLRRYCRESGREVCHSSRKFTKPDRPSFQRSMSSALSSLRPKIETGSSTKGSLRRQDSGYMTGMEDEDDNDAISRTSATSQKSNSIPMPTNTTQLEFSNYAHIDVRRRGAKSTKKYQFDYWGFSYMWKRSTIKLEDRTEFSYHLVNTKTRATVASIVPVPMSRAEAIDEESKGGWIKPCSLTISDPEAFRDQTDIADVVVATGLIALVDDTIKQRWHSNRKMQFSIPTSITAGQDSEVKAKTIIHNLFNRRGKTETRDDYSTTEAC